MGASAVSTEDSGASITTADIYPEADLLRLQSAVRVLLSGVGEDISREGLRDTPKVSSDSSNPTTARTAATYFAYLSLVFILQRVAKAWVDVSSGYKQDLHRSVSWHVYKFSGSNILFDMPLQSVVTDT